MGMARHATIPAILVGDIDRGGVFAAFHGTLALLEKADQALISGLVVNRFRGDAELLQPGLKTLEGVTHRPVLGVLPWLPDLWLDSEDSLSVGDRAAAAPKEGDRLRVAVVRLPRISNFTDIDALSLEPQVEVVFVDHPRALHSADVVVLPAPERRSPTSAGCASADSMSPSGRTSPRAEQCWASAVASRCWAAGSAIPLASRASRERAPRDWACSTSTPPLMPARCWACHVDGRWE